MGPLAEYFKPVVTNLGFKMDSNFKLNTQIRATVKYSFYHLRRLAKVRPILSRPHFETVIHAFISSRLDHSNALYFGVSQLLLSRLQVVQKAVALLLTELAKEST